METSNEVTKEKKKKNVRMAYENENRNFLTVLEDILSATPKQKYLDAYKHYLTIKIVQHQNSELKEEYQKKLDTVKKRGTITQEDIALITGNNKATVGRWLNRADVRVPNADTIVKIAKAFDITSDFLLGINGTSNKEIEAEYKVFEKYGIDADAFLNLNALYSELRNDTAAGIKSPQDRIHYDKTLAGLNLLLKEVNTHGRMDILSRIGYFLTQHRFDNYYYFDNDDVENLYDSLFKNISAEDFTEEHVKYYLDGFLSNAPQFTIDDKVLVSLDTIRDRLKEYKEQIDPDFFKPSDAPLFFPSKETHEFEESFNDDELIEDDNELIDIAFTGRDIDIE